MQSLVVNSFQQSRSPLLTTRCEKSVYPPSGNFRANSAPGKRNHEAKWSGCLFCADTWNLDRRCLYFEPSTRNLHIGTCNLELGPWNLCILNLEPSTQIRGVLAPKRDRIRRALFVGLGRARMRKSGILRAPRMLSWSEARGEVPCVGSWVPMPRRTIPETNSEPQDIVVRARKPHAPKMYFSKRTQFAVRLYPD